MGINDASEAIDEVEGSSPTGHPHVETSRPPILPAQGSKDQRLGRRLIVPAVLAIGVAAGGMAMRPAIVLALNTVSTDDAYVNGHVTFVAPRVAGQVARVLVDDNMRVRKGDLLVSLDDEPYRVGVSLKQAAVANAEADVKAAEAQVRGTLALARSQRWQLQASMEQVDNQVALLRARVATLRSKEATYDRARSDLARAQNLLGRAAIAREEFDQRRESERVAEAQVILAREEVSEVRVGLGLAPWPEKGEPQDVPADLNQTSSAVRQALANLVQSCAQVGLPLAPSEDTPRRFLDEFIRRDREGNIDRIIERIVPDAPAVRQALAKLLEARRDLTKAELDLRYCAVRAEIDGVVTRRNVNPGNNVQVAQALMAIRSLAEIWIDANFKETQLADIRIGHPVDIEVDMYAARKSFRGRVTGFTMGTGQTLSVLPAQNATGNFVKVVQRLPVRIELDGYDPEADTLFAGISVVPYVRFKETPTGPGAGRRIQEMTRSVRADDSGRPVP